MTVQIGDIYRMDKSWGYVMDPPIWMVAVTPQRATGWVTFDIIDRGGADKNTAMTGQIVSFVGEDDNISFVPHNEVPEHIWPKLAVLRLTGELADLTEGDE
jgi:hypothetical protein